jgi:hypothetical protein
MTTKFGACSQLTGGGVGALDAIPISSLNDGDIEFVATGTILYVFKFIAAATDAENSPSRIRPNDYATSGVWYLQNVSADYSQIVRNDIDGGDITTSGQVITVTPCSCWDSSRGTFLQTIVNKTWTVAATNNLEVYLFLVRLNNGTIDVKGYSTYAGAASDVGVNITHWRFISWNRNNGSGVLMPCRQVGDKIIWYGSSTARPVVTSSLTTSLASYTIPLPLAQTESFRLTGNGGSSVVISYSLDGTNVITYNNEGTATVSPEIPCGSSALYAKYAGSDSYVHVAQATFRR